MNFNNPKKIKISISKKYKEVMEEDCKSSSDNKSISSKEEDFKWVEDEGEDSDALKKLYLKYPFKTWNSLLKRDFSDTNIKEGPTYQDTVCQVFKEDIFKGEDFSKEENNSSIFKQYIEKELKIPSNIDLNPDFIIKNIKVQRFIEIINSKNYMFRTSNKFNVPQEYEYITVLGETKINPDSMKTKKKQKENYINFRNFMNTQQKKVYFVIIYVFDHSFSNFWKKKSIEETDFIICYIPKLFRPKYYEVYEGLCNGSISPKSDSQSKNIKSPKNIFEQFPLKELDDKIDSFIKKKEKELFSIIKINEVSDDMQANPEEQSKIKDLKNKFQNFAFVYKQSKKNLEIVRMYEDEMIKKKRKRENEILSSKRKEEDKKYISFFDDIENLFRESAAHIKKDNNQ